MKIWMGKNKIDFGKIKEIKKFWYVLHRACITYTRA